ncbi:hypothetical protein CBM2589_A70165 [Cupriavidus taiwanensis]|uniref:Uncharacterized protein n=1 Tax=Cupriavidus taiwanensis TaxID=164546 RepID=A0A975XAM8_9BURK|nr:hypothetical protein CBM2589_A70165 [Cupriavidus taiwanensis]
MTFHGVFFDRVIDFPLYAMSAAIFSL